MILFQKLQAYSQVYFNGKLFNLEKTPGRQDNSVLFSKKDDRLRNEMENMSTRKRDSKETVKPYKNCIHLLLIFASVLFFILSSIFSIFHCKHEFFYIE